MRPGQAALTFEAWTSDLMQNQVSPTRLVARVHEEAGTMFFAPIPEAVLIVPEPSHGHADILSRTIP